MKQIIITKGKVVLVDNADYEWLNQWKWHAEEDAALAYNKETIINYGEFAKLNIIKNA